MPVLAPIALGCVNRNLGFDPEGGSIERIKHPNPLPPPPRYGNINPEHKTEDGRRSAGYRKGEENMARRTKPTLLSAILGAAASMMMVIPAFAIDEDIVILHTNDTHCGIEDNLGFEGLAAYKKQALASTPYVTLVDAGDAAQGAPVGTLSEGEYIIRIMNQAGYDVAIPGNHEFDYGMEQFLALSKQLDCGYYSCNFMDLSTMTENATVFKPYKLIDYDDVTVAYVGVTTPESITKSRPDSFQSRRGNYIYGFCEDSTGEALYGQVQGAVDAARAEGADYVILVSHLGSGGVTEIWSSRSVIANTSGINAVIDGHSHETMTETVPNRDGAPVCLAQTGTKFENIGKMTITPSGEFRMEMLGNSEDGASGFGSDADMKALIAQIKAQYEESLKTVLGRAQVKLTAEDPETGARAVRNAETNLGDFCADAYRFIMGADIGIMNGGGIRAGIEAGDLTYEDALNVYPYGNMICVAEVTGRQLRDALEMGARFYPEESGGFIHVSGMAYTIDSSVPSGVQTDEKRNFTGVSGEYRVRDILVGGEPLDLDKTYTVATHNYWLKSGGDGMSMFTGCPIIKDETMVDVDTITAYIRDYLGGVAGEEYADPRGQGRITIR